MKKNKIFLVLIFSSMLAIALETDTEVLDSRCGDIREKVLKHQISVQKAESVAASEMITGGNVVDATCLNSFDISLKGFGFSLPNIDDLLDNFFNSLCDKANSVISSNVGAINQGLDLPIGSVNINSNYDGKAIDTEAGQNIMNDINKNIPDIPIINKQYKSRVGGGTNGLFYQ